MFSYSSPVRTYRHLVFLALAHAAVASGLLLSSVLWDKAGLEREGPTRSWVGLVTLWFLWPVVLMLHRGRSATRFALFALLAALLLLPSLYFYDMAAPPAFGLPWGVSLTPWSAWKYGVAYRAGRAEAKKDVAAGVLAIEEHGFGAGSGPHVELLCERYQIEIRGIAGCFVNETILGHAAGYNAVSRVEIDRRVGLGSVDEVREEGYQLADAQRTREEQYFKDLAKRLSGFSSDSKITLESVQPWMNDRREIDLQAEEELGQFLRDVERFISEVVPEDAPAFDLHVSATLTSTERPKFETSASLSSPRPVYDRIYKTLPNLPLPQWKQGRLSVALDFKIRETR